MEERLAPPPQADCDDTLAYVVLERARLCCERETDSWRAEALRRAHCHLGMAGYLVSEHLEPEERRQLLGAARDAREMPLEPAEDPDEEALLLARHAAEIVARCMRRPGLAERMHEVHVEVLDALQILVRMIGPRRARALNDGARRTGQFSPSWQRRQLAAVS